MTINTQSTRKSPQALKQTFRTKVGEFGLNRPRARLLSSVQDNWVAGQDGMNCQSFRLKHQKNYENLEWLQSNQFIGSINDRYIPKTLGFCVLLVLGNTCAIRLRVVIDAVAKHLLFSLRSDPSRTTIRLLDLEAALKNKEDNKLLFPAIHLLQDLSVGIGLSQQASKEEAIISFSDHYLYKWRGVTAAVWDTLENYRLGPQAFIGLNPVSIPFDLNRLKLVPDAYANAQKAIQRLSTHPDSAVSSAKATLEATFKLILNETSSNQDFPQLAKSTRDALELDGKFTSLGRSIIATASAINDIRNLFGDSHGKHSNDRGPTRAEAQLAVGATLLLCDFLIDRWEVLRSAKK